MCTLPRCSTGLHAAWIIGFTTAVFGSRCGLISGATAVRAVLVAPFIEDLGIGCVCLLCYFYCLKMDVFAPDVFVLGYSNPRFCSAPFLISSFVSYLPWIVMMISIYQFLFGVFKVRGWAARVVFVDRQLVQVGLSSFFCCALANASISLLPPPFRPLRVIS